MLQLIKTALKAFMRQKAFLLSYLALAAGALIYSGKSFYIAFDGLSQINEFTYSQRAVKLYIVVLAYFLFISYEYFLQTERCGLTECFKASGGLNRLWVSRFAGLFILGSALTAAVLVEVLGALLVYGSRDLPVLLNIICAIILNYLGTAAVGVSVGFIFSAVSGRIASYICFILFVFFSSPVTERVRGILYDTFSSELTYFWRIFPYSPAVDSMDVPAFGFNVLEYRYCAVLFWTALAAAVGVIKYSGCKSAFVKLKTASVSALCILFAVVAVFPSSSLTMSNSMTDGIFCDHDYYKQNQQLSEEARFNITELKLTLRVGLRLKGEAEVTFDNATLPEYKFTLHHCFKVTGVYSPDGQRLSYIRNGDYLSIEPTDSIKNIKICYKGSHPRYYSNSQGAALPGFFPYYPMNGYREIYSVDMDGYIKNSLSTPAKMSLEIKGLKKPYTNLPEVSHGVFEGTARALTVVSGFYAQEQVGSVSVLYPTAERNMGDISDISTQASELIATANKYENGEVRTIIVFPSLNSLTPYENCSSFGDHILIGRSLISASSPYIRQLVPDYKVYLYDCYNEYLRNPESLESFCEFENMVMQNQPSYYPIANRFKTLLESADEQQALSLVEKYVFTESDTRSVPEFFESEEVLCLK